MSADPAVFTGRVDSEGKIHLEFPQQQRAYCKRKLADQCVDVIVAPQGLMKSRLQEAGFHSMITPWAKAEGHRIDDLKRDLLREIFGELEHTNPINGVVLMVLREPHTSTLSRAQYSELIERTLEIGGECGQILEAPNEYRERKAREATAERQDRMSRAQMWVVYDERAIDGTTDDYAVLESCKSKREAMRGPFDGVVYRYDIADGNELINETMIGPTRRLAKRPA